MMHKETDFDATIRLNDGQNWAAKEKKLLDEHVRQRHSKRSAERVKRNQMLSVLYRLETYLHEEVAKKEEVLTVDYFTKEFCKVLDLNKKQFAWCLDTDVSNLNKYLKGQRTFSTDLALKFSHFFHTTPDIWLKVQLKNELIMIIFEEEQTDRYKKYDYEKLVPLLK